MQTTSTTIAAPGRPNEDYVAAGPSWALLLDGATQRPGVESGCVHDVPWLVAHLGGYLAWALSVEPKKPLADMLAEAIRATRYAHGPACDLDNPDSPSSTVAILRERPAGGLDYLVLGDSPLVLVHRRSNELEIIEDNRSGKLPSYTPESVRALRNHPDGFWIASTNEQAAAEAVTGTVVGDTVHHGILLSDGITRYVERLGLGGWRSLVDDTLKNGAGVVIDRVRAAEELQLRTGVTFEIHTGRRVKQHDDASAVVCAIDHCQGTPVGGLVLGLGMRD